MIESGSACNKIGEAFNSRENIIIQFALVENNEAKQAFIGLDDAPHIFLSRIVPLMSKFVDMLHAWQIYKTI